MNLIKLLSAILLVAMLSSCSYHSNTYPAKLRGPEILTDDFQEGNKTISIRSEDLEIPDWSFRIFGKRILPKLNKEQKIYVKELERLRQISKQLQKIEKMEAKDQAKIMRFEKKIEKINNFPNEVKAGKSNFFLWLYTHDYKKVGYEYVYSEKALFWGLIKWGKRRT